jgi:hypothetical protein
MFCATCFGSTEINYEIINRIDRWLDSLAERKARRKAATYTGQHKQKKNPADIHASSGIRTHDPSV